MITPALLKAPSTGFNTMFKRAVVVWVLSSVVSTAHSDVSTGDFSRSISISCSLLGGDTGFVSIERQLVDGAVAPNTAIFDAGKAEMQRYVSVLSAGDAAECVYPSGSRVRLKVGEGKARGYGQCGADPQVFLSLWVNQRKIESKLWFAGHCMKNEDYSFQITGMGSTQPKIQKCHEVRNRLEGKGAPDGSSVKAESCVEFPDVSNYPVDELEYQNGTVRSFDAGDYTVLHGAAPVCAHVETVLDRGSRPDSLRAPRIAKDILKDVSLRPEEGIKRSFEFNTDVDADGDGKIDRIYGFESYSNYMNAHGILMLPGNSASEFRGGSEQVPPRFWYLPCQLDAMNPQLSECPPLSQKRDDAGIALGPQQEEVFFRARYTHMLPFMFDGAVYFFMSSESADTEDYTGVVRLTPDRSYETVCLLNRATENF